MAQHCRCNYKYFYYFLRLLLSISHVRLGRQASVDSRRGWEGETRVGWLVSVAASLQLYSCSSSTTDHGLSYTC